MADDTSTVTIQFRGNAQSLDAALKSLGERLGVFAKSADTASAGAHKVATGELAVEKEARGMARGVMVAADSMALLSKESSAATMKLYQVRSLAMDMRGAFSNMGAAISGGMAAFAGVAAFGFVSSSVKEAVAGQVSWAQLGAAIKGTGQSLADVHKQIADGKKQWEAYGITQVQVAAFTARGLGMGLSTKTILGDPKALADTAKLLNTDIPTALNNISKQRGSMQVFKSLGLNMYQQKELSGQTLAMSGDQRAQFVMQQVEASKFSGQADAAANTAAGKYIKLKTTMQDVSEEVGNGLLPALTSLADATNNLIDILSGIAHPFGGLANVLKATIVPLLALAFLHFTGLGGVIFRLVGTLLGRLVGGFATTANSMGDADVAAQKLGADIKLIPESWLTLAKFMPDPAKEAWIANIGAIPRGPIITTGEFKPGVIPAMAGAGAIEVPVMAGAVNTASVITDVGILEKTAKEHPVTIPVKTGVPATAAITTDVNTLDTFATRRPVKIPVITGIPATTTITTDVNTLSTFASTRPVKIPAIMNGPSEAAVLVKTNTLSTFAENHPVKIPAIMSGASQASVLANETSLSTFAAGHPVKIHSIYMGVSEASVLANTNTLSTFATMHPVKIPFVVATGSVGAVEQAVNVVDAYAALHPAVVHLSSSGSVAITGITGGTVPISPILAPGAAAEEAAIRAKITTDINAAGPIPVRVTPQWVSNAAQGLKQGLAMGVGFGIVDALFNGLVTIKHADMPNVTMPTPTPSPAAPVPPPVYDTKGNVVKPKPYQVDVGTLGPALTNIKGQPVSVRVSMDHLPLPVKFQGPPVPVNVQGHPYVGLLPGQSLSVNNIGATGVAGGTTVSLPPTLNVNAKQSGPWSISLNMDAFNRFGQMVAEIAFGSAIGNVVGGLGLGGIKRFLARFKKGKDGQTPDAGPTDLTGVPQTAVAQAESILGIGTVKPFDPSLDTNTGLMKAFSSLNWKTVAAVLTTGLGVAVALAFKANDLKNAIGTGISDLFKNVNWGLVAAVIGLAIAAALLVVFLGPIGAAIDTALFGALALSATGASAASKAPKVAKIKIPPMSKAEQATLTTEHTSILSVFGTIGKGIVGSIFDAIQHAIAAAKNNFLGWVTTFFKSLNPFGGGSGGADPHKQPHKGDVWIPPTPVYHGNPLPGHWAGPGTGVPLPPKTTAPTGGGTAFGGLTLTPLQIENLTTQLKVPLKVSQPLGVPLKAPPHGTGGEAIHSGLTFMSVQLANLVTQMKTPLKVPQSLVTPLKVPQSLDTHLSHMQIMAKGGAQKPATTTHIGAVTIHVNGAQKPEDVGREVVKQLTDLVQGTAAHRRLNG